MPTVHNGASETIITEQLDLLPAGWARGSVPVRTMEWRREVAANSSTPAEFWTRVAEPGEQRPHSLRLTFWARSGGPWHLWPDGTTSPVAGGRP